MNVQELIDTLSDMNPEAEVKLAFQPEWAFQNRISQVVAVPAAVDGLKWGAFVRYADGTNMDEEFCEASANTRQAAVDLVDDLTGDRDRMKDNGIVWAKVAATIRGELMTDEQARDFIDEHPETVFIADGGQESYLDETAAEMLGWSRR